jgi:ABC-type sugar transport system ATPase subunit
MSDPATPLLRCQGLVKTFPGVQALKGVDFTVTPGRVHGLVGENGAGKSTLLKILAGVYRPDGGAIQLDGAPLVLGGTDDALGQGIVTIHQDINLIGSLTVADNIMLNNEPTVGPLGFLKRREIDRRTEELLRFYEVDARPQALVSDLPNDAKKMIQILKAIVRQAKVLLMDEPTSSLTDVEVRLVLRLIRSLAEQGVGVVFVSHYLSEVFEVCDEITVLRDGAVAASGPRAATSLPDVVRAMLGRSLETAPERRASAATAEPLLAVEGLSVRGSLRDISFTLHRGEVLGFTGLTGSGLTELARALFGSEDVKRSAGRFAIAGRPAALANPAQSLKAGMALLTNDRLREGILPDSPLYENICLPILDRFVGAMGLLDQNGMVAAGRRAIERLRIRAPGPSTVTKTLSGGNQQKVLFAKWLETQPKIFILDEPTIGIDVGSKFEIRGIIESIAAAGVGVILISAELADIESLCDRVLVMFRGAIVGEFAGAAIRREAILHASVSGRGAA